MEDCTTLSPHGGSVECPVQSAIRSDTITGLAGNTCHFYRLGCCRFGSTCRFVHSFDSFNDEFVASDDAPDGRMGTNESNPLTANTITSLGTPAADAIAHKMKSGAANHQQPITGGRYESVKSEPSGECTHAPATAATAAAAAALSPISPPPATDRTHCRAVSETEPKRTPPSQLDPSIWIKAPVFVPRSRVNEDVGRAASPKPALPLPQTSANAAVNLERQPAEPEGDTGSTSDDGACAVSTLSYASIVKQKDNHNGSGLVISANTQLCTYFERHGYCPLDDCCSVHGQLCELCGKYALHPMNQEQQRKHNAECIKQHELDMEHSFAVQRSRDKTCGVCLEIILEKPPREQRFGILPNCNHIFCLDCIRTWRKMSNFENNIKRGCPTCRTPSDFVCPSFVWVESGEEKERLIRDYKKACNSTDCKHFRKGAGTCPFGNRCFYRHATPEGELVDVGAPSRRHGDIRGQIRRNNHVQLQNFFFHILNQRSMLLDDFVTYLLSDDEESEGSDLFDYEF
ncbi:probable E3 ubiquitin-protein ligase makorin-1 [Anopheles albimanus]|nr:probable E3 ubiquitin-protein ligase makorin-1 [Anopheles albimanus]XP_035783993.1 probable E3 ubiquitin-protein ligase makorin-1 [Anopheles albimanus]